MIQLGLGNGPEGAG